MNDIPNVEDVKVDYSKVMEAQEKKNKKHQPYPATDYKTVKEIFIHSMKNYADETLILQKVEKAVRQGAKLLCGGHRIGTKGYFFEPTVLDCATQEMDIIREETFGPILPIVEYTDIDDAIAWANDCEYGLTSSVYTQNLDYAFKIMRSLKFGETYINRENFEAMQGFHAGWRKSGIGGADGKHGLEEYLQTHVVYIETKE